MGVIFCLKMNIRKGFGEKMEGLLKAKGIDKWSKKDYKRGLFN